jgi:TetR/AcrR family transcriptional regulator, regulator of cefoperazone and chloramphenicol sensitivity
MTSAKPKPTAAPSRAARSDGDATRSAILDVAGQVFAQRGYADATSKEICALAGVNIASVNYHFGSRGGLYQAVLVEAHNHLLRLEEMQALAAGPGEPRQKLRAIVSRIVEHVTGPRAHWGSRVVVRELLSPSEHATVLVQQAIAPKARILIGIVSQIVGLPPTHPAMQRSLFFTVAPCLAMLLAPAELRTQVLPGLGGEPAQLADDLLRYALAGMDALGAQYRA